MPNLGFYSLTHMFITLGFYHVVISWLMCPVQKHSLSLSIRKLAFKKIILNSFVDFAGTKHGY